MRTLFMFFVIGLMLIGCTPSESAIETAIAETSVFQTSVAPTETYLPPTFTPLPPTDTPTPAPTPDTRVVIQKPKYLILTKDDLPKEGKYIIPNETWSSPRTNDEVIQERGVEEGNLYLSKTGRVGGWEIAYAKPTKGTGPQSPLEIDSTVIQYKTLDGPDFVIEEDLSEDSYTQIDVPTGGKAAYFEDTFTSTEGTFIGPLEVDAIYLDVAHRNFLIQIYLYGTHGANQISKELAIDLAMKVVEKIENEKLYENWIE